MKKIFIVLFIFNVTISVSANDFMKSINDKISLELSNSNGSPYISSRETPNFEFVTEPTEIMMNYYDYMPGSYWSIPIRIQPPISQPNGIEAGGIYILFHARENATSTREIYC